MNSPSILTSLFNYKAWANAELFAELHKVDAMQHEEPRHTAIRLLNHIYVVDGIFAAHLSGLEHSYTATNTIQVTTGDLTSTGKLIDTATQGGATRAMNSRMTS